MFPVEPIEFAVLVVYRTTRELSTPFADFLLRVNVERRRYPSRERS